MQRLAIIVAVIVAVMAVAVAVVPFLIPADFLRARVAERIASLTGRTVTLTGDPSLAIYPHLAVTVEGLAVANPEGMGTDPFVVAETMRARVRLLPLLIGRIEFDEFELIKPTIHLVVDNEGRQNWTLAGSAVAKQAAVPLPAADVPASQQPLDLLLGRLTIDNGTILYDDLVSDTREEMTAVDLEINWPSASASVGGRGTVLWRGETLEFTGLLAAPLELMRGSRSPARFAIASTPLRASFSGAATYATGLRLDGEASVSTPSMRRTIEWLGTPMGTGPILGAAAVRGNASIADGDVIFDSATVELDGNSAEGSLSVSLSGARPVVRGTLALGSLDLSAYVEAIHADLISDGSWLIAPARLTFAEAVDADIRVSAGEVTVGKTRVGKMAAAVGIKNGALDIAVGEAEFYGGSIEGRLTAAPVGDSLSATAEAKFTQVPAQIALADIAGVSAVGGAATISMDVAGQGRSWAGFARSVKGTGIIAMARGSLSGLDVPKIADTLIDPLAGPISGGSGTTSFDSLAIDLAIDDGTISTTGLVMRGSDFRLTLAGQGSLFTGAVDGRARLATSLGVVPLAISGTWRKPIISRAFEQDLHAQPASPSP
jgi:AsmA protein